MKKLFLLSAVVSLIIFTACNKQEMGVDLVPATQESTTENSFQDFNNTINAGSADFTIDNEENNILERDILLLTNKSTNAVSYEWDFGNGFKSTEAIPNYKYLMHGNYTVTLTITDTNGNTHVASQDIVVLCIFGGGSHDQ